MTGIDKPLGFLRAATRVVLVDQPLLIVHELVQVAPRPRERLTKVIWRHLQDLAAYGIADTKYFSQKKISR